jgi:two-component system, NarL family, sensor kinase
MHKRLFADLGPPPRPGAYRNGLDPEFFRDAQASGVLGPLQQLIDDLPEEIGLLDAKGAILAVNYAWRDVAQRHGFSEPSLGSNYLSFCVKRAAEGYGPAIEAAAALTEIVAGNRNFWQLTYNGETTWRDRDFHISFHRIGIGADALIVVTRSDLTEITQLRRARDDLSKSLVESQTQERQRLARELHDSTSQVLTSIGLLLMRLRRQFATKETSGVVDELQELLAEMHEQIRLISYLAHPPSLEQLGLIDALKTLVDGFARRASIEVSFETAGEDRIFPAPAEAALYRVAQEALSNAHRHAHPARVRVLLVSRPTATHLIVADDGVGMSSLSGRGQGVGLPSMRSRLSEIGGRLGIKRLSPGTAVIACVRHS